MKGKSMRDSRTGATGGSGEARDGYAEFIAGLQILDLFFIRGSFQFSPRLRDMERLPALSLKLEAKLDTLDAGVLEAVQTFTIKGREKPKAPLVVSITCELVARYRTSVEVTPELFEVFRNSTLILNTWPYLREFVQSCTVRAGLPPLVLPLTKFVPERE